ncbi:MAG: exodeoxyribonuclease V subunit gamma [Sedimentisphaerales bacterium]|nr:exodeoxyribonuclease V subunit gamma [Sedimentisphaerales bacterium]
MSVQFILGRSGSGKSYHCLEAVRGELSRSAQGEPLILLVPEQATFQMEQALLTDGSLVGYNRATVVSFGRLAQLILQQTRPLSLTPLSEQGKEMILRRLVQEHQSHLKIFGQGENRSGFILRLSEIISELRQYQKTPGELLEQRERLLSGGDPVLVPLAEKLADLAVIYQAYLDYIDQRFVDPDDYLDLMSPRCGEARILRGARMWVDGFAGFTPQQFHALLSVIQHAQQTQITLCLDPGSEQFQLAGMSANNSPELDDTDLFHPILQTYRRLMQRLEQAHYAIEPAIILSVVGGDSPRPGRFMYSGQLAQLEANFFSRVDGADRSATTQQAPKQRENVQATSAESNDDNENRCPGSDIIIAKAANRRIEVQAVAREIQRLCREKNYRFRDIAVILRDFNDYQELVESCFEDHGIAYFIDQRRSVRHHPLIELLRSALQIINSDFQSENVLTYLKTDLPGIPRSAVDILENYALAHGINSHRWHGEKAWCFNLPQVSQNSQDQAEQNEPGERNGYFSDDQLNHYRQKVLGPLVQLRDNFRSQADQTDQTVSVRQISTELLNLMETIDVGQTLSQWFEQAQEEYDLERASIHQQVYTEIIKLFDELVEALGDVELTVAQYTEIFTSALGRMNLALVPPALDQVLVGTIERSRHPKIRAAFVLGVNEGKFPRAASPEVFFTDEQRELLGENDFELAPTATEKMLHERYLAYIAMTRPSEFLWVSYPVADEKGTLLAGSSLIDNLQAAVGDVSVLTLADAGQAQVENICNIDELAREMALVWSEKNISAAVKEDYQQLYQYCRNIPEWSETIQSALNGMHYNNHAKLDEGTAGKLFPADLDSSVSRLESFAACPFQYFGRYVLALEPREELRIGALDIGNFYHDGLCFIFQQLQKKKIDWRDLDDGHLNEIMEKVHQKFFEQESQFSELHQLSQRNRFIIELAGRRLRQFCLSLGSAAAAGDFYQKFAELKFAGDGYLPALVIPLTDKQKLLLRGQIDRVDFCERGDGRIGFMVVDYKSSAQAFPYNRFFHGLALQLISYLLILQENYQHPSGQVCQAVAALYLPIKRVGKAQSQPPPPELLQAEKQDSQDVADIAHKAKGIIDGSWHENLDRTAAPKDTSRFYDFYVNKEGSVFNSRSSSVVKPEEMSALQSHCQEILAELGRKIVSGDISVAPYRLGEKETPCGHCDFKSFCRFDPRQDHYHQLGSYKKEQVLKLLCRDNSEVATDE